MKLIKVIMFSMFGIIALAVVGSVIMFSKAKSSGKTMYNIQVNNYQNVEQYFTDKYTVDSTGCLHFKDMMGLGHTVCNNKFSITEF